MQKKISSNFANNSQKSQELWVKNVSKFKTAYILETFM